MIIFVVLVHWVRLLTLCQRWLHSFTQWMKPNAVTLEPCGLTVLQPLSEHNVVTIALPLSEHNVVTICSFGLWATKAAHFWHQKKASIWGCCSFKTIFFRGKVLSRYFIRLSEEGFNSFQVHTRGLWFVFYTNVFHRRLCLMHNSDLQIGTMKRPSSMHTLSEWVRAVNGSVSESFPTGLYFVSFLLLLSL